MIQLTLPIAIHHLRKSGQELIQGRNLEASADAEAMMGAGTAYWLASSGLLTLLFYQAPW